MGTRWYSGDWHFGHAMVARHRGYGDDIARHDADLIRYWNTKVRPGDDAWILGDLFLKNPADMLPVVAGLNGVKHLITGNHDRCWPGHRDAHRYRGAYLEVFATVQEFARHKIAGQSVLLSHFPYCGDHTETERYLEYRLRDTGGWLLHAHVHGGWLQRGRMINVGADAWRMCPVRLDDIEALLAAGPRGLECPPVPAQAANELTRLSEELGLSDPLGNVTDMDGGHGE